jgi:hypothetical protein
MAHVIDHGSYGGYQQHQRLRRAGHVDVDPCDLCRAAANAYREQWRLKSREVYQRHIEVQYCRDRALRRLAKLHPEEFDALYDEELSKSD